VISFAQKIEDELNPEQLEAVRYCQGPLLILAGAGSGKTRVLIYKAAYLIAELQIKPWNIMAVTFTNKAAEEMRARLANLVGPAAGKMQVSTFHSFCALTLRKYIDRLGFDRSFGIYDQDDTLNLIKHCLDDLQISSKTHAPRAIAEYISRAKEIMVGPEEYAKSAAHYFNKVVSRVYQKYQEELRRSNALDFDDLLFYMVILLEKHPDVRAALQEKYTHILVDEYQDTNHVQFLLIKHLAEKAPHLTVVGDEDQSIYGWRGADIKNIMEFEKAFPNCRILMLEQNYRSTQTILQAASEVIRNNRRRKGKTLWTAGEVGQKVDLVKCYSDREEAEMICDRIEQVLAAGQFTRNQIALLYRTNAQSRALEESLKKRFIPYAIVGGLRFYQRKEIKDLLAYLRLLLNPRDLISFQRILNVPRRNLGPAALAKIQAQAVSQAIAPHELMITSEDFSFLTGAARAGAARFRNLFRDLLDAKEHLDLVGVVTTTIQKSGILEELAELDEVEAESRRENLEEFLAAVSEYAAQVPGAGLQEFMQEIALYTDIDTWDDRQDMVTLMTLHSAKGLEFPLVFITGLEEGLFPISRALEHEADLEEERRLFYVGLTRACRHVILSYVQRRMRFGELLSIKSRFVDELPIECLESVDLTSARAPIYHRPLSSSSRAEKEEDSFIEDKYASLCIGRKVVHPTWGPGVIISRQGASENTTVEVRFEWGGEKKLFAKYANLKVL